MNDIPDQPLKRRLLALLAGLPWLGACRSGYDPYHAGPAEEALRQRFGGLGIELVVDVALGAEKMAGIVIRNDLGYRIFGQASMGWGGGPFFTSVLHVCPDGYGRRGIKMTKI